MDCCCHFPTSKNPGNLRTLKGQTLNSFKTCLEIWRSSEKQPENSITTHMSHIADADEISIHKACYSRLTDKRKLESAKKRKRSEPEETTSVVSMVSDRI